MSEKLIQHEKKILNYKTMSFDHQEPISTLNLKTFFENYLIKISKKIKTKLEKTRRKKTR